jgi:tRNA (guanine37-N1)-methyltransferase
MRIDVITLFPQIPQVVLSQSIIGRARQKGAVKIACLNPRDFAEDKHKTVDSRPYGGATGMLMKAEPLYLAIKKLREKDSLVVMTSPRGKVFNQTLAKRLAKEKHLIFVCGRYEGVDARIYPFVSEEISLGDFIITGGEIAACAMIDAIVRLQDGTFAKDDVTSKESFENNLLEAPQYTRPEIWRGKKTPEVLLSGNHAEIEKWKRLQALKTTKKFRPDLLDNIPLKTSAKGLNETKRDKRKIK